MKRNSEHSEKESVQKAQNLFFNEPLKKKTKKNKREALEELAIEALRRKILGKIKEELGEDYTEEAEEELFSACIEESKKRGIIDRMIQNYINRIHEERIQNKGLASQSKVP